MRSSFLLLLFCFFSTSWSAYAQSNRFIGGSVSLAINEDRNDIFSPLEDYQLSSYVGFQVLENLTLGAVLDYHYRVSRTLQFDQVTGELIPHGEFISISYGTGAFLRQRKIVTERFRLFYQIEAIVGILSYDGTIELFRDDSIVDGVFFVAGIEPGFEFDLAKRWFFSSQTNLLRFTLFNDNRVYSNKIRIESGFDLSSLQFALNYRF